MVEAASSSLVTQTISSIHNKFQLWTLDIFISAFIFRFWSIIKRKQKIEIVFKIFIQNKCVRFNIFDISEPRNQGRTQLIRGEKHNGKGDPCRAVLP